MHLYGGFLKRRAFVVLLCIMLPVSALISFFLLMDRDDLALNKKTAASSEIDEKSGAKHAIDRRQSTSWISIKSKAPQWIHIDLSDIYAVNRVVLGWDELYAEEYKIQVSTDFDTWINVYQTSEGDGGIDDISFKNYKARYVRMYISKNKEEKEYALNSFKVYEGDALNCVTINKPYPQSIDYKGCIKPNNATQDEMNSLISDYFEHWKKRYVKESNGMTPGGGYYVEMFGTGGDGNEITTSEAHGYGMIVFSLMAGCDPDAKKYFDGMYNMYDKHRSTINANNMSWVIDATESASKDSDSATDGDMDIAYSLLLAHEQWGSDSEIDYLSEAKRIINNGIKASDMNRDTKRVMLGDWDTDGYATRPSDWMTSHFHTFSKYTNDDFWNDAVNTVYSLISEITQNYSQSTGLMPDFVVDQPPRPADAFFLEAETDGDYSWNSCRYPWRITMDYAHYNTIEAKNAMNKVAGWIKVNTGNKPKFTASTYTLEGRVKENYPSVAFIAPFVTSCIVDKSHQDYLNAGWNYIKYRKSTYYDDSINLLCMLVISGNWWNPADSL